MRSIGNLDRHTRKVVERVNERRNELGLTQESLAQSAGVSVSALRSKLLYRTGAAPDFSMLGGVSVALGWDARYLPGLWSGEYDFDTDPLQLDAAKPVAEARNNWRSPPATPGTREAALEKKVRVQGAKIRMLEGRLAEQERQVGMLTARLDELTVMPRKQAV